MGDEFPLVDCPAEASEEKEIIDLGHQETPVAVSMAFRAGI